MCEKSDGIRCLLYFTGDNGGDEIIYLIDRKNDYYWVEGLHFPRAPEDPSQDTDWGSYHVATLLDGELLWDEFADGRRVLKYLVFDCLMLDGTNLMGRTLDKRLAYFMDKVYKPYSDLCKRFPEDATRFKFTLEKKSFQLGYGVEMMFRKILPELPHGSDGLIFTCVETPYKFGTDENILKWKPVEENTIDFQLELDFPDPLPEQKGWEHDYHAMPIFTLHINHGDKEGQKPYGKMFATPEEWNCMKQWSVEKDLGLDGQIVECRKDSEGRWRFNRFRDDKTDGNFVSVVGSVLESIEDPVSEKELISAAGPIRDAWKARAAEQEKRKQDAKRKKEAADV